MNSTLKFLKENNLPITRENYLYVAYLGNSPEELDAEVEMELPKNLRIDACRRRWKRELEADLRHAYDKRRKPSKRRVS